ncbi:MAG: AAA domain-containing protein [Gammaproteobacteria bacterium]
MPRYNTQLITELAHFVLGIDVNTLNGTVESTSTYAPIRPTSESFHEFYAQYQPLILDEVMATLQTAVNKFDANNKIKVNLQEKDRVNYYPHDSVTMLHLANDNRIQCDDMGGFHFIVLIVNINATRTVGILNIFQKEYQLVLKGDFSQSFTQLNFFEIFPIASLVNLDRMYSVCVQKPKTTLLDKVMRATVSPWPASNNTSAPPIAGTVLNAEQQQAVDGFTQGDDGVYLLQGPPGTGKTTTVVSMIQNLAAKKQHILVCAPSNKAIQVLAEKTLKAMPNTPMLMIAVESKISSLSLQEIALDNWEKRYPEKLKALLAEIDVAPLMSRTKSEASSVNEIIDTQTLIKFIHDVEAKSKIIVHIIKSCARYITHINPEVCASMIQLAENELLTYLKNLNVLKKEFDTFLFPALPAKQATPVLTPEKRNNIEKFLFAICNQYNSMHSFISYELLKYIPSNGSALFERTQILFCTLSIAGRMSLQRLYGNQSWSFQSIIIDEAGQAVEAEALIPFNLAKDAKRALLVGDTRQLPATTIGVSAKDTHFEHSMMWRLLEVNKQPFHSLMVQYRMRENIRHFPSHRYYDGKLIDHESIANRHTYLPPHMSPVSGIKFWVDTQGQEEHAGLSYINRNEALSIVALIKEIRKLDSHSHIGIISFYNAQVKLITHLLKNERAQNPRINPDKIAVHSVDGFQGDEKDIIIVSFVRANQHSNIGFLRDFRRLNVAITRAKDVLYIFGSVSTFKKAVGTEISELLDYLSQAKMVKSSTEAIQHVNNTIPARTQVSPTSLPMVAPIQNVTSAVYRPVKANTTITANKFEFYSVEELIAQAKRYFTKMKYEQAIENYSYILKKNSQHKEVYYLIAECYHLLGNINQAQIMRDIGNSIEVDTKTHTHLATTHPVTNNNNNTPNDFFTPGTKTLKKARELSDQGEFQKAEAMYIELLDDSPEDPEILLGLGWALNKQRKHKEALRYFELSIAFSKTPLGYQGIIQCYILLNKLSEALDYIYEGLEYFPWSKTLATFKTNIEARVAPKKVEQNHTAKPVINGFQPKPAPAVLPQKNPSTTPGYIAQTTQNNTANQASSSSSSKASEKLSATDLVEFNHALTLSKQDKNVRAASNIFKNLHGRYPNNIEILNELGWCLHILHHNTDAIGVFKKTLKICNNLNAYYCLARCYRYADHLQHAIKTIDEGLKFFPNAHKLLDYKNELNAVEKPAALKK